MPNPTQQPANNTAEHIAEAVDLTTAETGGAVEGAVEASEPIVGEGASKHKIERAIAGIPDAFAEHKEQKRAERAERQAAEAEAAAEEGEADPSKHRIERAVAGVPDALTTLKEKKQRAAGSVAEEGEPEHKLEKLVMGAPDQLAALEDEAAEHVKPVIEQTSADAKARSHEIGSGAVMIVVALVIAIFGIPVVLLGIAELLALVMPLWAGLLIVGLVLLVIAGICTYSAKNHFSKAGEYDVSLRAGIRKSFDYFFKGIGMPDEMAEELRESK